jgi:methylated-DNA-[protein]-cysteine S-methyltransferase
MAIRTLFTVATTTPDGNFHLIIDEKDVTYASGFSSAQELKQRLPEQLRGITPEVLSSHPYQKFVQAYYSGDKDALNNIKHMQEGSAFQKKVWQAIRNIGYGDTISYKELANKSGNPAAIRAAGTICGLNRLILLVPCHRVVKSDGTIGSYLYGPKIKTSLLAHEDAEH